ncbi:MAG: efflux RND transporter permease subunit, partial [Pseudomonadota bacterium]
TTSSSRPPAATVHVPTTSSASSCAGAESRQQIGWVIVGGMSLGTLLTIFVVPTVYTLFARSGVPGEITTAEADHGDHGHHGGSAPAARGTAD